MDWQHWTPMWRDIVSQNEPLEAIITEANVDHQLQTSDRRGKALHELLHNMLMDALHPPCVWSEAGTNNLSFHPQHLFWNDASVYFGGNNAAWRSNSRASQVSPVKTRITDRRRNWTDEWQEKVPPVDGPVSDIL